MPRNGERLEIGRKAYFEYPAYSNSMISDYLESPRLFYKRHVAKTIPPVKETPAMRKGTLGHLRVLEPKRWKQFVQVAPTSDKKTKKYQEFVDYQGPEAVVITPEENDWAEAVYREISEHSLARNYLLEIPSEAEVPIAWDCPHTSLRLKALLDSLSTGTVKDLKFVTNPKREFWKSYTAKDRAYHRQAAHYLDGVSALTGVEASALEFVFIMVQNEEPFDIFCHRLSSDFLAGAWEELKVAKQRIARSLMTDDWYPPGSLSVQSIDQPLWQWDTLSNHE